MPSRFPTSSHTRGAVRTHVALTAGTNGAVPASFTRARGVASITKGTHKFTIKLSRGYMALLDWSCKVIQATPDDTGAWEAKVTAEDVAGSGRTIEVSFFAADGTAVDMATDDKLSCTFELKTSPGLA